MRQVYFFGSRARGDNRPDSDFCVVTPGDYGLFGVGGFFADLRDTLGLEIDVVCEESLGTTLASGSLVTESTSMRRDMGILRDIAKSFPLVGVIHPDIRIRHGVLSYNYRQCYRL
ncbi:nucleotidyltransferase family protein [Candidatus Methanoprimaticola sp. MG2]|uniref:nucleotidyltransferase family protein n=1 Tax=Candidatus Methanoprimaticola sp. MG2 TaxID=3228838 RepID=UPI0039C5E7B4